MVQIQSMCSSCRAELDLTVADIVLLLPVETEPQSDVVEAGTTCPPRIVHDCEECGATSVRTIEWRLARLLRVNGVAALPDLELEPAVEPHPENPPAGPALTADDIIELHEVLERTHWFAELLGVGPTT
jgi:hypothetical protein